MGTSTRHKEAQGRGGCASPTCRLCAVRRNQPALFGLEMAPGDGYSGACEVISESESPHHRPYALVTNPPK